MNTDLQKLNEITDYYNGLQKEASLAGIAAIGYAGARLIPKILPKVLKFLPKGKAAAAAGKAAFQPSMKSRLLGWIASKGKAGKAFVQGVHNAGYANRARTYASSATDRVLAGGKAGRVAAKGAVKPGTRVFTVSPSGEAVANVATKANNFVPKMNPYQLGANATWGEKAAFNAGRFINPNNYKLQNRLFFDYMAGDKIADMAFGGGKTNNASLTPQEMAYYQGNPVYDNYGFGYGYDA